MYILLYISGYGLFEDRLKTMVHWFEEDEKVAIKAIESMRNAISSNVIVVDIASGKTQKSVNLLSAMVKDHPDRKVFYIPIDISDVILDWEIFIKDFDIANNVVGVKPLVSDAIEAIDDLSKFCVINFSCQACS